MIQRQPTCIILGFEPCGTQVPVRCKSQEHAFVRAVDDECGKLSTVNPNPCMGWWVTVEDLKAITSTAVRVFHLEIFKSYDNSITIISTDPEVTEKTVGVVARVTRWRDTAGARNQIIEALSWNKSCDIDIRSSETEVSIVWFYLIRTYVQHIQDGMYIGMTHSWLSRNIRHADKGWGYTDLDTLDREEAVQYTIREDRYVVLSTSHWPNSCLLTSLSLYLKALQLSRCRWMSNQKNHPNSRNYDHQHCRSMLQAAITKT